MRRSAGWGRRRRIPSTASSSTSRTSWNSDMFHPRVHPHPNPLPQAGEEAMRTPSPLYSGERVGVRGMPEVTFELNGRQVTGKANETLIEIADREGVEIP